MRRRASRSTPRSQPSQRQVDAASTAWSRALVVTPKDAYENAKLEAEKLVPGIDKALTATGECIVDAEKDKIPKIVVAALRAHYEKDWQVTTYRRFLAERGIKIQLPKPATPPGDSRTLLEKLAGRHKPK